MFGNFWQAGVHQVPWLRIRNPHVDRRLEPARIIQTGGRHADPGGTFTFSSREPRSAVRTKTTPMLTVCLTLRVEMANCAARDSKGSERHIYHGGVRSP